MTSWRARLALGMALYSSSSSRCDAFSLELKSTKGQIYVGEDPIYLRGINWFGAETIESTLQGLYPYATTMDSALKLLADNEFNAVRVPVAMNSVLSDEIVPKDQVAGTPSLIGKTYLEVLDVFINKAREYNMVVLLANQRIDAKEPDFPDTANVPDIQPALEKLADRYCHDPSTWNLMGFDLKVQPKGNATWGDHVAATDWQAQATTLGNAVLALCDRYLIFVEGVQTNIAGVQVSWGQAGGSLQGVAQTPVNLTVPQRVVYSPNVISPGVDYKSPWWDVNGFPNSNMPTIWDQSFGFLAQKGTKAGDNDAAVVVASWGARMVGRDKLWAIALSDYLSSHNIGSFYWAFNPQSGDLGGFVKDDWQTPIDERVELIKALPVTSFKKLLAKYSTCTSKCAGNGNCIGGKCQCNDGWSGPQCEICSPGDGTACNGKGTCQKGGKCQCDADAQGLYCDGKDCGGITCGTNPNAGCVNGQCVCTFDCVGKNCQPCFVKKTTTSNTTQSTGGSGSTSSQDDTTGKVQCEVCRAMEQALATGTSLSATLVVVSLGLVLALLV